MKSFPNKVKGLAIAVCTALVFLSSCEKEEEKPVITDTIATLINSNSDISLFKYAINKAKLNSFTEGPGPFTVLAPNNAAFNAIGITSEAQINALDSNALVSLLSYHILAGTRSQIEIPKGPNAPLTTINALTQYAAKNDNGTFINGSKFVTPDLQGSNGYLHIINRVLLAPVSTNVYTTLTANPDYKLFVQAINKAAVSANFTATGPITVFAPNNAAFVAAGLDSTAIANSTPAILSPIVRYHIYNGRLFGSDMVTGTLKMQTNATTTINAPAKTIKGTTNPAPFQMTTLDILVSNGIIHAINGVLKP